MTVSRKFRRNRKSVNETPASLLTTMSHEKDKEAAAKAAMQFVHDGMVLGLGTGSTALFAIRMLGERVKDGLRIAGIATSTGSEKLAAEANIPLTDFDHTQTIDVTIDGADEFDPKLNLIKGGGGALLREKIVASASRQVVIIADSSKQVATLGKFPLPVEVIGFAQALIARKISALGATVKLRQGADGKAYITDEGHHILDCSFGSIADPVGLARQLSAMPGIVEHGLFIGMAGVILVSKDGAVEELRRAKE